MPKVIRITHFISFSGERLPATAENYAADAARYTPTVHQMIAQADQIKTARDRHAYALQAGLYARAAAHSGRCALRIAEFQNIDLLVTSSAL